MAISIVILSLAGCSSSAMESEVPSENVIVAYISGGEGKPLPDFDKITHLNYAFGRVSETFNSVDIENPARFIQVAQLKNRYNADNNADKKMQLSIGGWGSGRFSEMVADSAFRNAFVADCKRIVEEYGIDGIDLDWEYPSSGVAGISSSPDDIDNYTLLVRELRAALGPDRLLTMATICTARFMDVKAIEPYMDFFNIMSYDMAVAPYHHAPLKRFKGNILIDSLAANLRMGFAGLEYMSDSAVAQQYGEMYRTPVYLNLDFFRQFLLKNGSEADLEESPAAGQCTAEEAVMMHLAAGIPASKLTLGMPFYGKSGGGANYPFEGRLRETGEPGDGYTIVFDEVAQVPYIADAEGNLVYGFENEQSIRAKCRFAKEHGLLGAMYWEYCIDAGRPEADSLRPDMLSRNGLIDAVAGEMLSAK